MECKKILLYPIITFSFFKADTEIVKEEIDEDPELIVDYITYRHGWTLSEKNTSFFYFHLHQKQNTHYHTLWVISIFSSPSFRNFDV